MVTEALLRDAMSGIEDIFGDRAIFSCLTGSALDATVTSASSDIDLVIVLHNDVDQGEALATRAMFTRFYTSFHRGHGYVPDYQWPGEVLYQCDLDDALRGATFRRNSQLGAAPRLCANDWPHRYWVSMVGTGKPLTGAPAFRCYAQSCARLMATHATRALANEDPTDETYWSENWQLPVPSNADRTWRIAEESDRVSEEQAESQLRPYELPTKPVLELCADQWTQIAREAVRLHSTDSKNFPLDLSRRERPCGRR